MKPVVGLLFSKDRAMQLDATIRSLYLHCQDIENMDVKVIWTTSDSRHEETYQTLVSTYAEIEFISQVNFDSQLLASIAGYEFVLFLVDDNIFVRDFSIYNIIMSLSENPRALGFSLRLGTNTNYCYALRLEQQLPTFMSMDHGFLKFDWPSAQYDFGYPLEVSSSVYRTQDINAILHDSFANPNLLEAHLNNHEIAFEHLKNFLLCNQYSYTFCNPVNKVQSTYNNRVGEIFNYSPDELREMFAKGYRINVEKYSGFIPNGCHQEVELNFFTESEGITLSRVPSKNN